MKSRLHEPALVLHVRPYRETSAIVQFLTPGQGRLAGVMRGIRSAKQQRNAVQPFYLGTVTLSGRGDLLTVNQFELLHFIELSGEGLYAGFYILELLTRVLREREADAGIFRQTLSALEILEECGEIEPCLRNFELDVLQQLGLAIPFNHSVDPDRGGADHIEPDHLYGYTTEDGFYALGKVRGAADEDAFEREVRVPTFKGADLIQIGRRNFSDPNVRRSAKRLLRRAFKPLLGDRPLMSRAMFLSGPKNNG